MRADVAPSVCADLLVLIVEIVVELVVVEIKIVDLVHEPHLHRILANIVLRQDLKLLIIASAPYKLTDAICADRAPAHKGPSSARAPHEHDACAGRDYDRQRRTCRRTYESARYAPH